MSSITVIKKIIGGFDWLSQLWMALENGGAQIVFINLQFVILKLAKG
jgi:hypothetical protein